MWTNTQRIEEMTTNRIAKAIRSIRSLRGSQSIPNIGSHVYQSRPVSQQLLVL